jgi:hypothetical protein
MSSPQIDRKKMLRSCHSSSNSGYTWKFYGNSMEIPRFEHKFDGNSAQLWRVARLFGVFFGEEIFFIENAK